MRDIKVYPVWTQVTVKAFNVVRQLLNFVCFSLYIAKTCILYISSENPLNTGTQIHVIGTCVSLWCPYWPGSTVNKCVLQALPSFGPFLKEREAIMASHKEKADLLSTELEPEKVRPALKADKPAPLVKVSWSCLIWSISKLQLMYVFNCTQCPVKFYFSLI